MYSPVIEFYALGKVKLVVNAYHVEVYRDGKLVFDRHPADDDWLDEDHGKLIEALNGVENAVKELIK